MLGAVLLVGILAPGLRLSRVPAWRSSPLRPTRSPANRSRLRAGGDHSRPGQASRTTGKTGFVGPSNRGRSGRDDHAPPRASTHRGDGRARAGRHGDAQRSFRSDEGFSARSRSRSLRLHRSASSGGRGERLSRCRSRSASPRSPRRSLTSPRERRLARRVARPAARSLRRDTRCRVTTSTATRDGRSTGARRRTPDA